MNQFSYAAYSCEMPKSLFATFTSIDTFSQHLYSEVAAKFLAVLEAVSDCLGHAVDTNRNAINPCILDSLCQCLAGESNEAQFQATGQGLFCFKVDGHPNRGSVNWEKAVEPDCGLQANDAINFANKNAAICAVLLLFTNYHLFNITLRFILPEDRAAEKASPSRVTIRAALAGVYCECSPETLRIPTNSFHA